MRKKRKHDQVVRNLELLLSISFRIARHAKHDYITLEFVGATAYYLGFQKKRYS